MSPHDHNAFFEMHRRREELRRRGVILMVLTAAAVIVALLVIGALIGMQQLNKFGECSIFAIMREYRVSARTAFADLEKVASRTDGARLRRFSGVTLAAGVTA